MEEPRKCLKCGEIVSGNIRKKFCNEKCRTRYCSAQRYQRIKDDPAYKEYRRKYFANWVNNNREKFNAKMRELSRKWQAQKRVSLKEQENVPS